MTEDIEKTEGNEGIAKAEEPGKEDLSKTGDETETSQHSEHDESGDWEEIVVEKEETAVKDEGDVEAVNVTAAGKVTGKAATVKRSKSGEDSSVDDAKKKKVDEEKEVNTSEQALVPDGKPLEALGQDITEKGKKASPTKAKKGRKKKDDDSETTTPEVTPKKRGRKPKAKAENEEAGQETQGEETPVKKKRGGRKAKNAANEGAEKKEDISENVEKGQNAEEAKINAEEGNDETDKAECEATTPSERQKDDSPLSARNKQNAPVGVVKPEVRQGVIVENKMAMEGRPGEPRRDSMNPLQGMRDLAMGSQVSPSGHQSSFTPYSQSNYGNPSMPGYISQPGFQNYPPHGPHPQFHGGPSPSPGYHGHPGMPHGGPPHGHPQQGPFPPSQGPMSPNQSYPQQPPHGSFMSSMQHGAPPPAYFPHGYRPDMNPGDRFSYPGAPQGPYQPGSYQPGYHPQQQGPYAHGPRPGYEPGHFPPMGPDPSQVPHPQGRPQGGPYHQGMPYNYPVMGPGPGPQGQFQPPHSFSGPSNHPSSSSMSQPVRPQSRLATTSSQSSPSPRLEASTEPSNRGFMMDNILKPSNDSPSVPEDVDENADVSDIDRYTSFLCKDK